MIIKICGIRDIAAAQAVAVGADRMGFIMSIFFALASALVNVLPGAPFWDGDSAFRTVFGSVPKVTIASLLAFIVGSNINALIMSHLQCLPCRNNLGSFITYDADLAHTYLFINTILILYFVILHPTIL